MKKYSRYLIVLLWALLSGGCTWFGNGSGEFSAGALTLERCSGRDSRTFQPFSFKPNFFTINEYENIAEIRIQEGGQSPGFSDFILLQLLDWQTISNSLNTPLAIDGTLVRGALYLFNSCPDSFQATTLRGTITFSKLGKGRGDKVEAVATFDVVDARDASRVLASGLTGEFDFKVTVGQPYQMFTFWPESTGLKD